MVVFCGHRNLHSDVCMGNHTNRVRSVIQKSIGLLAASHLF